MSVILGSNKTTYYRTAQKLMDVLPSEVSAEGKPRLKMRRLIVLTPVEEAAVIMNPSSNELVAWTNTRSLVVRARAGTVVQSA